MANEFKVRKGLVVNGSGSVILDIQGSQGQLFSVTDQLSGSLFSVNDISGVPVLEAFSDSTVKIGQYLAEAIIVSGSTARITGSMALSGFSTGSVLFAGTGGAISQNNSNFFWDNTNGRLGIGTNAPTHNLHIYSPLNSSAFRVSTNSTTLGGLYIDGTVAETNIAANAEKVSNVWFSRTGQGGGTGTAGIISLSDSGIKFFSNSGLTNGSSFTPSEAARITLGGSLLLGTTSNSGERLQVSGSSRFIGNMIVSGSGSAILNVYNNVNSSSLFQVGGSQNTNVSVNTQAANRFQLLTISRIGDPTTAAISLGVGTGPTSTSGVISVNNDSLILGYNIGNTFTETVRFTTNQNLLLGTTSDDTFNRLQVSGNARISQALTASLALISGSGSQRLTVQGSGSSILTVDGALGRLFSVDDAASGSLFSVNTISGLPIMEAFSDNTVRIGQFGQRALFVSQSRVGIGKEDSLNATLDVSGSMALTGSFNHQGNYTTTGVITAQTLVISTISSSVVYSSGSNVFGNDLSNTQVLTGSVRITGSLNTVGDVVIRGSGNTSATTALTIQHSGGTNLFRVRNDGYVFFGTQDTLIFPSANGSDISTSGRGLIISTNASSQTGAGALKVVGNYTSPLGNDYNIWSSHAFSVTSGSGLHSTILLNTTINQTGGANGITRGLYINPTLTSAWDFRAIEWTNNASATSGSWGLYGAGSAPNYLSGSLGIGTTAPSASIDLGGAGSRLRFSQSGSTSIFTGIEFATNGSVYGSLLANQNTGEIRLTAMTSYFPTFWSSGAEAMRISTNRNLLINSTTDDTFNRLQVTGNARISQALTASQALISGSGTQRLTVVGSGSAQPLFTVQGSQGELFSIVDSLSGSLFSVNDQSGLPIMEVFSDNTILMGNYLDPMLLTTTRTGSAAGINTIYSLATSSYDAVYIDYTIRSGSNARAGNFMAMWSGTSVNFTDNSITEFGSTSTFTFGAHVSGANMVVTGSAPTAGWTIKTIIKAI